MRKAVTLSQVVRVGTDTLPELRLLSVSEDGVIFAVDGAAHRMGWRLLGAWAGVVPGVVPGASSDVQAAYRSVYDAADRVRRDHTSAREGREGQITELVEAGRRERDRGDVVAEGEIARTLDALIGRWVDGKWIGGQAAILGTWKG